MLNLENFMKLLEDAMPSEDGVFSIDEKIMTKKQARRRKLRAKKRAQKLAQQKAKEQAKQELEQSQDVEKEEESKEEGTGTALVVYQDVEDEYEEISEDFTKLMSSLDQANDKHKQEVEQAMSMWKQAGEDNQCPEDAWNLLNTSITNYKNTIEQTLNSINLEKLAQPELQILDRYMTGVNGYIEKASQQIMATKPNLIEADFEEVKTGTDLVPTTGTDVEVKTGTALATTTGSALTTTEPGTTPLEEPEKKDDKRTKKKLVSYKKFWDNFKTTKQAFDALCTGAKSILEAIGKGVKALANLALQPISFLNDKLYAFLTSPLAKDIIKTFMYANPITKMLFDGDFGKLNIGVLDKVHNALNKTTHALENGKGKGDPTKEDKNNYTERKLPKSLDGKTLKQLKREFYSNKALVDLINVAYNHPDVKIQDKADLQKYTTSIIRAIKTKNVETIRSKFKSLIKSCDKICDYMDWTKPFDWQNLVTKFVAKGNTKKEQDKIDKKRKSTKTDKQDKPSLKDQIKNMSDEEKAALRKELGIGEAFEERITKLERLLEVAEGE